MKTGFTGTQRGMTGPQRSTLATMLADKHGEFHHGDCIGADAEAHDIVSDFGMEIVIHPPKNQWKRAFKKASRILPADDYIARNHAIVDATEELIATPGENEEQLRSGTWATIRYAKKMRRMVTIIFPDGTIGFEP